MKRKNFLSRRVTAVTVALVMLAGSVFSVSASAFKQPDVVDMFETFHGFVSNGDQNMPNGWKAANFTSDKTHRVMGETDSATGSNIMRMYDWCTNVYKFDETIKTGYLHISFDMKVDAPGSAGSACLVSGFNASINDNTNDYYNGDGKFQVYSNFMRFDQYDDGTMKLLIPTFAHNGITSGEYLVQQDYTSAWNKYDIFVDFAKGQTHIYSDGMLLATQPMGPDYTNIYDSLKAFSINATRGNNVYVDNVYMHHYQTNEELEAPKIALDYANAGVASQNGTVDVVFSEAVDVEEFLKNQFEVKNSVTGNTVKIEDVTAITGTSGARITLPSLEPGEYEVSVKNTVKGTISKKSPSNTATFSVAGNAVGNNKRYYINESFNSYKGGMPADFDAAQYSDYNEDYAKALTSVEGQDGNAIALGANKNIEYKFGEPIYSGKFTVEFDVNRSNGGWAVGLMSAGDFFYDDDYMEIDQYETRENEIMYSVWQKEYAATNPDWGTWANANKSQKFIEWQNQNQTQWLGEKISHYNTRKSKNLLVGNTGADNASAVYTAKGKSATGTDLLNGITIAENTWTHVKTVVDLDAGTYSFYVNDSTTPVVVSYTQPTTANKSYRSARFARDEFYNSTNSAKAPKKFIYGIQGIRLQSVTDTKYDNVKVYTDTAYNDNLDFNGKVDGTSQPGWYFSTGNLNYAYDAHRPESKIKSTAGASGNENDKALNFSDSWVRYYIHNFATPVKAGSSFEVEFDVKSNNNIENSRWLFGLMEEDYMLEKASSTSEGGKADNGEIGTGTDSNFMNRCFIGNTYSPDGKTFQMGKIGVNQAVAEQYPAGMRYDTGLTVEANEWNHIKLLIEPYMESSGARAYLTVSVTNKAGETKTSSKIPLHSKASRFYEKDTYGCAFYASQTSIDNFKVKHIDDVYKATVASINVKDVKGDVAKLGDTMGTNAAQIEVNLTAPAQNADAVKLYYPAKGENAKPAYNVTLEDGGNKAIVTLSNYELDTDITLYVSNKANIGSSYLARPDTNAVTFKITQSDDEFIVTDFRLYQYVEGRTNNNNTNPCDGAYVPVSGDKLKVNSLNGLVLKAKGYNTGNNKDVMIIGSTYDDKANILSGIHELKIGTVGKGAFSFEKTIANDSADANVIKGYIWNSKDLKPLADMIEYTNESTSTTQNAD